MQNVVLFEESARSFFGLLARINPDQWDEPGLGAWTVRSLAGHTLRAITTVGEYLAVEPPSVASCADAEAYLLGITAGAGVNDAIAQRGIASGELLAAIPLEQLTQELNRTLAQIAAQPVARVLAVHGGRSILLSEYLRTRSFELIVHSMDIARATGIEQVLPMRSVEDAAALAARVAVRQGDGKAILNALTGRIPLPESFSVV